MKLVVRMPCAVLAFALAACTPTPVPADKVSYVGEWKSDTRRLVIAQEGRVSYRYHSGNVSKSVNAPIKGFTGNDFEAGIGPIVTTFVVSQPPRQEAGGWTMVVDGDTLHKTGP